MTQHDVAAHPPSHQGPTPTYPGLFISFEGGDGVGKTTQAGIVARLLGISGVTREKLLYTREPGGTKLGFAVRKIVLDETNVSPRAEALLYAADRAHHVDASVRPALQAGGIVLTDRYLDSSIAYQGAARSLGTREIRDLSLWATGGLLPDLTVLLDAEPGVAAHRTRRRGTADRIEREPEAFHAALREEFLALAAAEPERFVVVDAARPVEDVTDDVVQAVVGLLRRKRADGGQTGAAPDPEAFLAAARTLSGEPQ